MAKQFYMASGKFDEVVSHDYIITLTHNFNVVESYPAFDYMLRNCVIEDCERWEMFEITLME